MKTFFNRYTWKQKNKGLWWGALVFLFIVYQASIKETLAVREAYQQAEQSLAESGQQEQELNRLKARAAKLRLGRNGQAEGAGNLKVNMLALVSAAAEENGIAIKDVPATQTIKANGLEVHYDAYCLLGSYDKLLQCWYELEKGEELNLVNVAFKKELNVQTRQPELKMYLTTAYVGEIKN